MTTNTNEGQRPQAPGPDPVSERAAVFVDYDNLYNLLARDLPDTERPSELATAMLEELQRYVTGQDYKQTAIVNAYADFSTFREDGQALQRSLYLLGAEPRFVPASIQRNAAEIQLCIDALDVLHSRPDIRSFILLTGDRLYLPLVQQFKRTGCDAFVATLRPPSQEGLAPSEDDFFFNAHNLLSEEQRRHLGETNGPNNRPPSQAPRSRDDVTYHDVSTDRAHRTLEIIEEYFGQYDEVYLTPLLRKLSEILGPSADPKSLISDLEDAGAVWLEKRRGSPYDYTVLLVDDKHPDVQQVHQQFYSHSAEEHSEQPTYGRFDGRGYESDGDNNASEETDDRELPEEVSSPESRDGVDTTDDDPDY